MGNTTLDDVSKRIKLAGSDGEHLRMAQGSWDSIYGALESAADKAMNYLLAEKCERSKSAADAIHRNIQELARTYQDEKAHKAHV